MKNVEIIAMAKAVHGIPQEVEVHTVKGWNSRGKYVIKDEKAVFSTRIWIPRRSKEVTKEDLEDEENKKLDGRFIFPIRSFFTEEQVR